MLHQVKTTPLNTTPWLSLGVLLFCAASTSWAAELRVSSDQRHLLKDGQSFLYLGDTGWDIFMRLDREEADEYLQNRADKGFNVITTMLLGYKPSPHPFNSTNAKTFGEYLGHRYKSHPYHADGSAYYANPRKWDKKTRGTAAMIREQAYWFNPRDGRATRIGQNVGRP